MNLAPSAASLPPPLLTPGDSTPLDKEVSLPVPSRPEDRRVSVAKQALLPSSGAWMHMYRGTLGLVFLLSGFVPELKDSSCGKARLFPPAVTLI